MNFLINLIAGRKNLAHFSMVVFSIPLGRLMVVNFDVEFDTLYKDDTEYNLQFTKDGNYRATGEGDAPKVFATILDIIKDFSKKADFETLSFEASKGVGGKDSKGRVRLYKTMVQRFAKKFGFTAKVDDSDPKTTLFTLRKENK